MPCAVGLTTVWQSAGWLDPSPAEPDQTGPAAEPPLLPDRAPVVGVSAGGRHRAYPLAALWQPDRHVLNDLLGGVPVTVTFCDLDDCVRVFTAADRTGRLDVQNGGPNPRRRRKMLLRAEGVLYEQDTRSPVAGGTPFPYADATRTRTTWGEWRLAHPDTDLYPGW